jgi:hypothetical protein
VIPQAEAAPAALVVEAQTKPDAPVGRTRCEKFARDIAAAGPSAAAPSPTAGFR